MKIITQKNILIGIFLICLSILMLLNKIGESVYIGTITTIVGYLIGRNTGKSSE